MTQAFNLAQLANNLNSSGQLDATDGLSGLVANANLASSGTASSTTFLAGDRTWKTAGGGFISMQRFAGSGATGGTFTWTRPAGILKIKVYVVGGGGGAQNVNSNQMATGGAGGLSIAVIDVSSISSVTVTIGAGGAGTDSSGSRGGSGGTTSFGTLASATGGEGGISTLAPYDGGEGGVGTTTVTGAVLSAFNFKGNGGQRSGGMNTQISGAGAFFGGGGVGAHDVSTTPAEGQNGLFGGGGGSSQYSAIINGGAGVVLVEEYA